MSASIETFSIDVYKLYNKILPKFMLALYFIVLSGYLCNQSKNREHFSMLSNLQNTTIYTNKLQIMIYDNFVKSLVFYYLFI